MAEQPDIMEAEQWRDVLGWEGFYQISDRGRVKSLSRRCATKHGSRLVPEKIRKTNLRPDGYRDVSLCKDHKLYCYMVHYLVCSAWRGPRPHDMQAAHLNGDKLDNRPTNLSWATAVENESHKLIHGTHGRGERNPRAIISSDDVRAIRRRYGTVARLVLSREYGISLGQVTKIARHEAWRHIKD